MPTRSLTSFFFLLASKFVERPHLKVITLELKSTFLIFSTFTRQDWCVLTKPVPNLGSIQLRDLAISRFEFKFDGQEIIIKGKTKLTKFIGNNREDFKNYLRPLLGSDMPQPHRLRAPRVDKILNK